MDGVDLTLSGAARAPPLSAATSTIYRAKEPFHVQTIPPDATPNSSPVYITHLLSLSTSFGTPTLLVVSDDSALTLIDKTNGVVVSSNKAFPQDPSVRITQAKALYAPTSSSSSSPPSTSALSTTATGSFVASLSNGCLCGWDTRSASSTLKPVWTIKNPSVNGVAPPPYLCIEPNQDGYVVAVGTEMYGHGDSDIDIYDLRQPNQIVRKYNEVHSDDITTLQFHPDVVNHQSILLSGSTDGLVSAIDITIDEEDDAVISVGNTGNSVARAGWIPASTTSSSGTAPTTASAMDESTSTAGGDAESIELNQTETENRRKNLGSVYAIGDMQTISVFDADKFDPILPTTDVRSSSCLRPPWTTDYVIDGRVGLASFPFNNQGDEDAGLTLFVGRSEGAFGSVSIPTVATPTQTQKGWSLTSLFPEVGDGTLYGHNDIVRSIEWDPSTRTLYSGGEDGTLCFWQFPQQDGNKGVSEEATLLHSIPIPPPTSSSSSANHTQRNYSGNGGGAIGHASASRAQRYTPYK